MEAAKSSADAGGGEAGGPGGSFPGPEEVLGQGPGEAEVGVSGDDQPGPAVRRLGGAELRAGPAERLLDHPEGMFKIEPSKERLPEPVDISGRRADA